MSKVFVDVGLSLDGYLAGPNRGPGNPLGDGGPAIHGWLLETATFRDMLGLPAPARQSPDDDLVRDVFRRTGAYVMGRRMFDEGEVSWPENPPFRAPVFVLTHDARDPWPRLGGTTFHFVTDGIASALGQAKAAADGKDVRISGGAETICAYLKAGLVDEMTLHIAPMLLGTGLRVFDALNPADLKLKHVGTRSSPMATHIMYELRN